jgi:hypothetical protein
VTMVGRAYDVVGFVGDAGIGVGLHGERQLVPAWDAMNNAVRRCLDSRPPLASGQSQTDLPPNPPCAFAQTPHGGGSSARVWLPRRETTDR